MGLEIEGESTVKRDVCTVVEDSEHAQTRLWGVGELAKGVGGEGLAWLRRDGV